MKDNNNFLENDTSNSIIKREFSEMSTTIQREKYTRKKDKKEKKELQKEVEMVKKKLYMCIFEKYNSEYIFFLG